MIALVAAAADPARAIAVRFVATDVGRQRRQRRRRLGLGVIVPTVVDAALCCYCHAIAVGAVVPGGCHHRPTKSSPLSWATIAAVAMLRRPAANDGAPVRGASADASAGAFATDALGNGDAGLVASDRRDVVAGVVVVVDVAGGEDGADDAAFDVVIVAIDRCAVEDDVAAAHADDVDADGVVDADDDGVDVDDDYDVVQCPIGAVRLLAQTEMAVKCWSHVRAAVAMQWQPNGRRVWTRRVAVVHATMGMRRLHVRRNAFDGESFAECKARSVAVE